MRTDAFWVLRNEVSIDRVIEVNGSRKVSCISPTHQDDHPSMHVYDDHVHCFACGFHGDVTDVWAVQRGIERPIEAALDLAREFNVRLPETTPEARQRFQDWRRREGEAMEMARSHHTLLKKRAEVLEWWESRGFGPELRERYLLGAKGFGSSATIPLWNRGRVMGIIRRNLSGERKYILPAAEELPDGHKPLFIPGPLGDEVFLVEGYIDALAIAATGRSAIAVGGTALSEAQQEELDRLLPENAKLVILPDDDGEGARAAEKWVRALFPRARVAEPIYGEGAKDIADAFSALGPDGTGDLIGRLAKGAKDALDLEIETAQKIEHQRDHLAYAAEHIAPLLLRITSRGMRNAIADQVVDQLKIKKNWMTNAMKDAEKEERDWQSQALHQRAMEEREKQKVERQARLEEAQPEINTLLGPGVLDRLTEAAARMHGVEGDRDPLRLVTLVATGAQLQPLPNGRPLGASILLTGEAGRGKNYLADAAVKPLPPEFYFAFEIASGQSLYYRADEDPEFLKHTFAYPNEIEGAEQLWEFLRPMLSKGSAHKIVTAKDRDGNMITREITVEGPVTIAIPTIRNKTDEQLQTRLLVAELEDYEGRVGDHSRAFSRQLLPEAVAADYSREQWLWHEALRQLTARRRVVFPLGGHEGFAFNDGGVSHGARLWANLLSLMLTHAWLEQRNREIITLSSGEEAIVATPEDYAAAYEVFTKVCQRSVVNLSDSHRKILTAVHNLSFANPDSSGFSQRQIAKEAGVSPQTISNNKTFLVTSAKMLKETDHGLALVAGVVPEEWAKRDLEKGLPSPEMVWTWWAEREGGPDDDPSSGRENAGHRGHWSETGHKAHTCGDSDVQSDDGHPVDVSTPLQDGAEHPADGNGHVKGLSISQMDSQNRIDKPNIRRNGGVSSVSSDFCVQEEIEPMLEPEEGWFDDF